MAQKVASNAINTAPISGTTTEATNQGSKLPSLFDLLATTSSSSHLGEDARKYTERIDSILTDAKLGITNYPVNTDKIEARVYVDSNTRSAIMLLFAESYDAGLDNRPPSELVIDVIDAFHVHHQDISNILQSIVVTKEDYACADNMAAFIMNAFATYAGKTSKLTIENFTGAKLSVVTNIDSVRQYVRAVSPHAVACRDDIGVLICLDVPTNRKNTYGGQEFEQKPFLAITGYTRFMTPEDAGINKFVPIVTITDIVSSIPNKSLLSIALPIAADAMIMQSLWARPYSTFSKDKPNVGALYSDSKTGKPYFISSVEEFHQFVRDRLTNPFLAIDITEGRARVLGIDNMLYDQNRTQTLNDLSVFLSTKEAPVAVQMAADPVIQQMRSFTGYMSINGTFKDTRCIDYLALAPAVSDSRTVQNFLRQPMMPAKRMEEIRKIYPDAVKNLYTTNTLVLSSELINFIASVVSKKIHLSYDTPSSADYSIQNLLNSGANAFCAQVGNVGFNPQMNNFQGRSPYAACC